MPEATELVGRLVRIADKIGIISKCYYMEDDDLWSLDVRFTDGEQFTSYATLIHRFLI
jgi:hypothetical protein